MAETKDGKGCRIIFIALAVGAAVYGLYRIVQYYKTPNAIRETVETLKVLGACLGMAALIFTALMLLGALYNWMHREPDRQSEDYRVRCFVSEEESQLPPVHLPAVLLLTWITRDGFLLSALPARFSWTGVPEDNPARYYRLSGGRSDPVILPWCASSLYYVLPEAQIDPGNPDSATGVLPTVPGTGPVEIKIDATNIIEEASRDHLIPLEKPLKLVLIAVNAQGQNDPIATRALYADLYKHYHASDDDDSWMYQSRPNFWPYS